MPTNDIPDTNREDGQRRSVHLVILIHGIRDFGEWEDSARSVLAAVPGIVVVPLGYEYFDPLRFLFPAFFQKGPQRVIAVSIKQEIVKLEKEYDRVDVSVIAHSFGTHVILGILDDDLNVDLKLENLILCGSVLPRLYNFRKIVPMVKNRIINYVGCSDIWPVMAKIATFGYGTAGTFGFQTSGPENHYFDFGHSGYFSIDFIKENWKAVFQPAANGSEKKVVKRRHPARVRWLGSLFNGAIPITLFSILFVVSPVGRQALGEGVRLSAAVVGYSQEKREQIVEEARLDANAQARIQQLEQQLAELRRIFGMGG